MDASQLEVGGTYLFDVGWVGKPFIAKVDEICQEQRNLFDPSTRYMGATLEVSRDGGYVVDLNDIRSAVRMDSAPSASAAEPR